MHAWVKSTQRELLISAPRLTLQPTESTIFLSCQRSAAKTAATAVHHATVELVSLPFQFPLCTTLGHADSVPRLRTATHGEAQRPLRSTLLVTPSQLTPEQLEETLDHTVDKVGKKKRENGGVKAGTWGGGGTKKCTKRQRYFPSRKRRTQNFVPYACLKAGGSRTDKQRSHLALGVKSHAHLVVWSIPFPEQVLLSHHSVVPAVGA